MNDQTMYPPARSGGVKFKHILLLLIAAFAGGIGASWWLASEYGYFDTGSTAPPITPTEAPPSTNIAPALPPVDTVSSIESRLDRINADAAAASGNAARAEGLLVAFAARRALDSGAPLGYLADQLSIRFGSSQPQAVSTILASARAPVTLETLQGELKALEPTLMTGNRDAGIWATLREEMSELFVLRREGSPSPAPSQRMLRAKTMAEAGNISAAMTEVSAMPGAAGARDWLVKARRYIDARTALDRLEQTALAAPPAAIIPPPVEQPWGQSTDAPSQ